MTEREAATVEVLYRLAGDLPERGRVQGLAVDYARVVEEEWPLMREGGDEPARGSSP